jgi:hypothetical protein
MMSRDNYNQRLVEAAPAGPRPELCRAESDPGSGTSCVNYAVGDSIYCKRHGRPAPGTLRQMSPVMRRVHEITKDPDG